MMFNLFLTVNEPDIKHLSRYLKICFLKLSVRRSYKKFQPLTTFAEKLNHIYYGSSYISLYPGKKNFEKVTGHCLLEKAVFLRSVLSHIFLRNFVNIRNISVLTEYISLLKCTTLSSEYPSVTL